MSWLADMYVTLAPGIIAGVLNMLWCTLPVARWLSRPLDAGRVWRDGRRVLGDNKTWKGALGMIVLGVLSTIVWGWLCALLPSLSAHNLFYRVVPNGVGANALIGLAIGCAYALFELPNSFLKRRRGIVPGKRTGRAEGVFFTVLDQVDSIIGLVIVVACVYPMTVGYFVGYIAIGAATHAVLNLLLFAVHLRKNPL